MRISWSTRWLTIVVPRELNVILAAMFTNDSLPLWITTARSSLAFHASSSSRLKKTTQSTLQSQIYVLFLSFRMSALLFPLSAMISLWRKPPHTLYSTASPSSQWFQCRPSTMSTTCISRSYSSEKLTIPPSFSVHTKFKLTYRFFDPGDRTQRSRTSTKA